MKIDDFHFVISGRDKNDAGAPWLVFLHGLLGSAANWRRVLPDFEGDFRILTLDQRGHGRSFHPAHGYAPEDFASDLLWLTGQLGISRFDLVGHSMGGRNAACFAALHPDKVERLVIEDIGPDASVSSGRDLIRRLRAAPAPFADKRKAKEYLLNEFDKSKLGPKLGQFLYMSITVDPDGRARWAFDMDSIVEIIEKGRGSDRWSEFEKLKMPVLVIRGEHSDELPKDVFERMKACNTRVEGVEILGAGHWVHFDKPAEFAGRVLEFLRK